MEVDQVVREIIEGVSNTYGEQFFRRITKLLGESVGADFAFIARTDDDRHMASTIALYANGEIVDNIVYPLTDSPCEQVIGGNVCIYPVGVAHLFPNDTLLAEMKIEAYIGAALIDAHGRSLGLVVALFRDIVTNPEAIRTTFQLFAGRISAEIERHQQAKALELANAKLEQRVADRTRELTRALNDLKRSNEQMVEQEKFASLGSLVAGISQEINTPLAIGVTSASVITEGLQQLQQQMEHETLSNDALLNAIAELGLTATILEQNLARATKLIRNFQQVAVDKASSKLSEIHLATLVEVLLSSLVTETKKYPVELVVAIPADLTLFSYPGDLIQVVTNLVLNSLFHGYPEGREGRVSLSASQSENSTTFTVCDDGIGIPQEHLTKVFEPFFTTKRGLGGSGLGLNVVYNIVHRKLGGTIELESSAEGGSCFTLTLPQHP